MMFLLIIITCLSTISLTNAVAIVNNRTVFNFIFAYAANSTSVVLINNQMPGPLIDVQLNDIIIVHCTNNLKSGENITVHFHGLLQRLTPQMDGVPYITQMPIGDQTSYSYVFRAYPAGTYFYHSHSGLQAVTAFGGLIIHDRRRPWSVPEVSSGPLLFSDLWLSPDRITQETGLLASPFVWQGEPTYLLINGKRNFVLNVDPNQQYLLRLIGATSLSTVVFGIDEHPMTIVEVDGTLIQPVENVTSLELASGQRYAVIIQTKPQANSIYLMQLSIRWRTILNGSNCTGVLLYSTVSQVPTDLSSYPVPPLASEENLRLYSFNHPYETLLELYQMPQRAADQEIYLYTTQAHTADGTGTRWKVNNASLDEQRLTNVTRPLLLDLYNGMQGNLPTDVMYSISQNQLIDVVLQNTVALNGVCESHPFHLHGHKFWLHSQGTGLYSSSGNQAPDTDEPVLRDTLMVYASSYNYLTPNRSSANYLQPCGWTKLRFVVDNPGLWLLHCHIGSHFFMGMTILFKEDPEHLVMQSMSQN